MSACGECERLRGVLLDIELYASHEVGCPGWYRTIPDSDYRRVKCIDDPCDCGLDRLLQKRPGQL